MLPVVFMAHLMFVSVALPAMAATLEPHCDAGKLSGGCAASTAVLFQQATQSNIGDATANAHTLDENSNVNVLAGVELKVHSDSEVAKTGRGEWIISLPEGCNAHDLETLAEDMPQGTHVVSRGHPEMGGLCVFIMEGTREGVWEKLRAHQWKTAPQVETDTTWHLNSETESDHMHQSAEDDVPWGLDRIDSTDGIDGHFGPTFTDSKGAGVHVYVIDTGIRTSHTEFGGRAVPTLESIGDPRVCTSDDKNCAMDVHGHGTFCAAVVGGHKFGVAPEAILHAVKVMKTEPDEVVGKATWLIQAYEWLLIHASEEVKNTIFSLSLVVNGDLQAMKILMEAAPNMGITHVVAAGNQGKEACNTWPVSQQGSIIVGAVDRSDNIWEQSNWGMCVDLYAPGINITSAWSGSDSETKTSSGTSASCPHVAGAAALLLRKTNGMDLSASALKRLLLEVSPRHQLLNKDKTTNFDRLLYIGPIKETEWNRLLRKFKSRMYRHSPLNRSRTQREVKSLQRLLKSYDQGSSLKIVLR